MATTPEEFFIKDLMEQPPSSPPVFVDLPQKPDVSNEVWNHVPNNDMMLPYISRVLMDDDIDDELSDHPALLQVQQPFAQILSSPTIGTNTNNSEGPNDYLHEGHIDESTLNSPLSKGTYIMGESLKDLEEANMLLPQDNIRRDDVVNQIRESNITDCRVKKRYDKDHLLEEEVRTTNKAVMVINELEEKCDNEMDKTMLHAYETCIKGMEHVTIDMEKRNRKSRRIKAARDNVTDIHRLLISCAQALAADDHMTARELLKKIKQHASATGDATQRLAHCFAKGLEARMGTESHLWHMLMLEYPSAVELLKACSLYSESCCFVKMTFLFSVISIMQAMAGKSKLHIVDYGTRSGFLWAGLLRLLASKEGSLPEVKITSIARPTPIRYPGEQNEKLGCQLMKCAHELGLPSFKFHTIRANWEDACIENLNIEADEVLVVNDLFSFSALMGESVCFAHGCPRDIVLNNISKMRPHLFIQSVINSHGSSTFLSRFQETLYYCTPLFDVLDATVPRECRSRQVMEQFVLGVSVVNTIACEGMDVVDRPEKYKQWQARNQRAGLRQLPIKPSIMEVVSEKVKKCPHEDFLVCQDGQWLLQGWKGRVLFAHSTWVAEDVFSG